MKITVVVDEAGKVIAAHVPLDPEGHSDLDQADAPMAELVPSQGQKVLDLDLSDDDVPNVPPSDFLEQLQRRKDEAYPAANG
jgi:hypothetical protein